MLVGPLLYAWAWNATRGSIWLPADIEDELDGMVNALAMVHPTSNIDKLDLKALNTLGDLYYACGSHFCWGRYVAAPIKTLSTRRLDFVTLIPMLNHHVLFAHDPNDGSLQWINLAWPGFVTAEQGVNEF